MPPGTAGEQKPPGKSSAGGPLAGLSKTGLGVVLPERALHLPAMESLAAPARLLPRTRPASADAVRRALLTAFWGSHGAPEDYAEQQLLNQLRSHKPAVPMPCILFTDPNKDPDDVVAFTLAKPLQAFRLVKMAHAVATLGERDVRTRRAGVARGVFDRLDLQEVRVTVGLDYAIKPEHAKDHAKFLDQGEALHVKLKPEAASEDSVAALRETLTQAAAPVTLVVIAGMTDPCALVTAEPGLVKQKVGRVVIMGGASGRTRTRTAMCSPTTARTTTRPISPRRAASTAACRNWASPCASSPAKPHIGPRCRAPSMRTWRSQAMWSGST